MRQEPLDRLFTGAVIVPSLQEIEMFSEMRADYLERCEKLPTMSRYSVLLLVCAHALDWSVDHLISYDRRRDVEMVEARQKMMAFCRVVSLGTPQINTWKGIAATFRRSHSTVIHATRKYGELIATALEVSK